MAFSRDRNNRGGGRGGFRSRPRFGDSPRPPFGETGRGPVEMHSAVCDNCGRQCEVPFRPTSGKPVYCSNCFENKGGSSSRPERRSYERSDSDLTEINAKLDNILKLLESQKPVKETNTSEPAPVL